MKLLTKISTNYFVLSLFVLIITGIMLFVSLRKEVTLEMEEQLDLQLHMVVNELKKGETVNFPLVKITKGNKELLREPMVFKDTLLFDPLQNVTEDYYYLDKSEVINGEVYRIKVMVTYIGWHGYLKAISFIFIAMAGMLIVLGALLNYTINRKILFSFLSNIKTLKSYSISSKDELVFIDSNIEEFKDMNQVLSDMVKKAAREYNALKEFTQNASHEIQTPLSILKSRLESISQSPVNSEQIKFLTDAKQAIRRLSRVNKGLLLLAKLENDAFIDKKWIQLDEILESHLNQAEDFFIQKKIFLIKQIDAKKVFISAYLIDILISNLLSNTLSHSASKATIIITLNNERLAFSNEGKPLDFPESKLFTRFGKSNAGNTGNGLGLSIIKQICFLNNWNITYSYQEGKHLFSILF